MKLQTTTREGPHYDFDEIAQRITERDLAKALEAEPGRGTDNYHCPSPNHRDNDPSFSLHTTPDGTTVGKCFGCDLKGPPVKLMAEVHGLDYDTAAERLVEQHIPGCVTVTRRRGGDDLEPLTLREYAENKAIAETILHALGVNETERWGTACVEIPYRAPNGMTLCTRYRFGNGFRWEQGDTIRPYGLDIVAKKADTGDLVFLVEGESDVHALAQNGFPAVGIPGANMWRSAWADYLDDYRVVAWREPDDGGDQLIRSLAGDIDGLRVIDAPDDADDPADLHARLRDREQFRSRMKKLARAAEAVDDENDDTDPPVISLREALDDGNGTEPQTVAPGVAWAERVTVLAAREKLGKSTFATDAAAAVSHGREFLDKPTDAGVVLWVKAPGEEHIEDTANRLDEFGAHLDRVHIVRRIDQPSNPIGELRGRIETYEPALVVVDSLSSFLGDLLPESGDNQGWERAMKAIVQMTRETKSATVLIHHGRKSDGGYRDSTEIGAKADQLIEMTRGGDANARDLDVTGRWHIDDYTVRLTSMEDGPRFEAEDDGLPVEKRVLHYITTNPGCSQREVREAVRGRAATIREALMTLEDGNRIEDRGTGNTKSYHPTGAKSVG